MEISTSDVKKFREMTGSRYDGLCRSAQVGGFWKGNRSALKGQKAFVKRATAKPRVSIAQVSADKKKEPGQT